MNRNLKGIEPIIAVVILVAVTLIIAIAVVGWIMGWWGATTSPTESLKITPVSANTSHITLIICNTGTGRANITDVVITDVGSFKAEQLGLKEDKAIIEPGTCLTITLDLQDPDKLTSGRAYEITIITASGNTYKTVVRVT
ncbi:MAG: archaellin/type IV pilin N-terminal domain-containing protein [Desulfurococcaceae archaeon]